MFFPFLPIAIFETIVSNYWNDCCYLNPNFIYCYTAAFCIMGGGGVPLNVSLTFFSWLGMMQRRKLGLVLRSMAISLVSDSL